MKYFLTNLITSRLSIPNKTEGYIEIGYEKGVNSTSVAKDLLVGDTDCIQSIIQLMTANRVRVSQGSPEGKVLTVAEVKAIETGGDLALDDNNYLTKDKYTAIEGVKLNEVASTSVRLRDTENDQYIPRSLILHLNAPTIGGDFKFSIGVKKNGNQISGSMSPTGMTNLNDKFSFNFAGAFKSIPGNSEIFVNILKEDSQASEGFTVDFYLIGEVFKGF